MSKPDKVNILLVDDQPQKLLTYDAILTPLGENLITAASGSEALEILLKVEIAVILVDVVMPEMDGPTLFKELRQRNPDLKIIFVSGYAEEAFAKSLPEGGHFAFLAKPFTLKQLVATVKETMNGSSEARSA